MTNYTKEKLFFEQAVLNDKNHSLFQYDYDCILSLYQSAIVNKLGHSMDEALSFLLQTYCHSSVYMTVEWIKNGMQLSCEMLSQLLVQALPKPLEPFLLNL